MWLEILQNIDAVISVMMLDWVELPIKGWS
jgi:hypothetical protein